METLTLNSTRLCEAFAGNHYDLREDGIAGQRFPQLSLSSLAQKYTSLLREILNVSNSTVIPI